MDGQTAAGHRRRTDLAETGAVVTLAVAAPLGRAAGVGHGACAERQVPQVPHQRQTGLSRRHLPLEHTQTYTQRQPDRPQSASSPTGTHTDIHTASARPASVGVISHWNTHRHTHSVSQTGLSRRHLPLEHTDIHTASARPASVGVISHWNTQTYTLRQPGAAPESDCGESEGSRTGLPDISI